MALSKRKMKKLGIPEMAPHGLTPGDKFYLYGNEVATVIAVDGTCTNGVIYTWNGRTVRGLPPGKLDTKWEKCK